MSHELRTPLNAIVGAAELLGRFVVEDRARGHLETITESADALLAIVNSILDFSKIEAGRMDIEKAPFSIEAVIEGAADVSAQLGREKGLVVQAYVDPSIPPVEGDAARLRQILLNLLGNAVKFTSRGQIVARALPIDLEGFRVLVRFEVEDSGRGIDAGALPLLFEPFVQVDKARTVAGTGLGLSISKRLVQLMGGEIGVESTPEVGSKFWFTVPFDRAAAPVGPIYQPLEGIRGLVVTKDDFFAQIIVRYLGSWGMESRVTTDPEELTAALESNGSTTWVAIVDADNLGTPAALDSVRKALARTSSRLIVVGAGEAMRKPVRQSHLFDAVIKASGRELDWGPVETQPAVAEADAAVTVLVVEDNARLRRLLALQFEELGVAAEFAGDGREAVEARRRGTFSVVFMDCQMPHMDGYEATRVIRGEDEALKRGHTPIVAMTANAFAEDREACLAAGMDDYLPKPVKLADLRSMIARWAKGVPTR
jgi:CheY-like chemotaxis protein